MAAQTFTVVNNGTVSVNITGITFNTPTGIQHRANLANFSGGSTLFTGASFTTTTPLGVGASKTFTVDHVYVSGATGTKSGTIVINASGGASSTINTTIVVTSGGGVGVE